MTSQLFRSGNNEHLKVEVSGDAVLDLQPVEIGYGRDSDRVTWLPASWLGAAGTTRVARTVAVVEADDLPQRVMLTIFYKVTDSTETIIRAAGKICVGG